MKKNSTSSSGKAGFTQSGVVKSSLGGSLLLASPIDSDVLLNSQTNDLKGTIATTSQQANPIDNFQVKSSEVNIGQGGLTARSVVLVAGKVSTPFGNGGVIRLVKQGAVSSVDRPVLSFIGLDYPAGGSFGVPGAALYVDTNDYVAVLPNSPLNSPVFLVGTTDYKPAYEFASDQTFRFVSYNGASADSPQIRGALSSAIGPLRDTIKEQLSAGFSKENLRKQLSEGVVLQTGVARPGIDRIDNAASVETCDVATASLGCAAK